MKDYICFKYIKFVMTIAYLCYSFNSYSEPEGALPGRYDYHVKDTGYEWGAWIPEQGQIPCYNISASNLSTDYKGTIAVTRSAYYIKTRGDWHGKDQEVDSYDYAEVLQFKIEGILKGDKQWITLDKTKYTGKIPINTTHTVTKTVPKHTFNVTLDDIYDAIGKEESDYAELIKPNKRLVFRVKIGISIKREYNSDLQSIIATTESSPTNLITCDAGLITVKGKEHPLIEDGNSSVYCIYEDAKTINISTANSDTEETGEPLILTNGLTQTFSLMGYNSNNESIVAPISEKYNSDDKYGGAIEAGQLKGYKVGQEYYIYRQNYINSDIKCNSNTLKFKVLPKVFLQGFSATDERDIKVCKKVVESALDLTIVKGKKVEITDPKYKQYLDKYGITYSWKYSVNGGPLKELASRTDFNQEEEVGEIYNYNGINGKNVELCDLLLRADKMEEGKTYRFYQYVTLSNFNNREVPIEEQEGYRKYVTVSISSSINIKDFKFKRLPKVCYGTNADTEIDIKFNPTLPESYSYVEDNGLEYEYEAKGTDLKDKKTTTSLNERLDPIVFQDIPVIVTVKDGCDNTVVLKDTIKVKSKPVMLPSMIQSINCMTSEGFNNTVNIIVAQGQQTAIFNINGTDDEYTQSKYYVALGKANENGEIIYNDFQLINKTTGYSIQAQKYTHAKIIKEANGCQSDELLCLIQKTEQWQNTIGIGELRVQEYRICDTDKNPAVLNTSLSGAYGEQTYMYAWKYSIDGETWTTIPEQNNKFLDANVISPNADVYYIIREVTSLMGTAQITDQSNKVTIRKYSTPKLELYAEGESKDKAACYGDEVKFEIKDLANVSEEGAEIKYNLFYKDASNTYHALYPDWSKESIFSKIVMKKDTTIYGGVNFCGNSLFSAKPINVSVGKNLEDFNVTLGTCRVKGDSVKVTLPTATGFTYNFIYNGKVYDAKINSIYVKLPLADKATYQVRVSSGNCVKTIERPIEDFEMQDRIAHHQLIVEEDLDEDKICAGKTVKIGSQNEGSTGILGYLWYENGNQLACTNSVLDYTAKKAGSTNTVVRRTDLYIKGASANERCMSVFDTIKVSTYAPLSFGSMTINDKEFCYGDTAIVYLNQATGGSGNGITYNLYKKNNSSNVIEWLAQVDNISVSEYLVKDAVYENGVYTITAKDLYCKSKLYADSTQIAKYNVHPDEHFTLKSNKTYIEAVDVKNGDSVLVNLTSPEIEAGFKTTTSNSLDVTYTKNGSASKSTNYVKGAGIGMKICEKDFDNDGVLRIGVNKGSLSCNYTAYIEIFYSKGFNAQPQIKCEESESETVIAGCRGDDVHLYVDKDNMPTYNESPMDLSRVTYQWFKLGEQSTVLLGGQTASALTTTIGDSAAYRCQIIYDAENTGKNLKRVYSATYIVEPIEVAKVGSAYFGKNGIFTQYGCADASQKVGLDADVKGNAKTTRMVWQSSTNGSVWTDLENTGSMVTGATTSHCEVSTEMWSSNGIPAVYFRLKVENTECKETAYTDNTIVLKIEKRPKMDLEKVKMDGNGVIVDKLTSLSFYNYRDPEYTYNWSYGNNNLFESKSTYSIVNEEGFQAGEDSIYVFKESENGCMSDTVAYHFKLYNTLSANWGTHEPSQLCPDEKNIDMTVTEIQGGTGNVEDYEIEWQYRTENMTSFGVIKDGATMPFTYYLMKPFLYSGGIRTTITFNSVKENFDLKAVVKCANYPGGDLVLPMKRINTVPRIKKGWIDASQEEICYDDAFVFIDAQPAEGGSGTYNYRWQKSEDKEKWVDIKEQEGFYRYSGKVEMPEYRLRNTTYFRRITTDKECASLADTSAVKTVLVLPEVQIPANVLNYYPAVLSGENVTIQPNFSEYDYIWNKIGAVGEEDTTLGLLNYGRYETEPLYDKTSYRYRVRYQNTPYCASAWDTITIDVLETGGVELFFENQLSNTDRYDSDGKYWICSGGEAGTIRANGSNGSTRHQWMYGINGGNLLKMYYEDGTPASGETVNADECQKIANALRNTEATAPATKYVSFCRVDTFIAGGRVIPVPSDTIKVYIVPSLSLSADVWNMADSLAGHISTSQRNYCVNEAPVNIKRAVSDNLSDNFWFSNKISPRMYDNKWSNDSLFISWEYAKGSNSTEWNTAKKVSVSDYLGTGTFNIGDYIDSLSGIFQVRSVLSDGCSSVYSNTVRLNWSDVKVGNGSVKTYAVLDDDNVITKGFEVGDSIVLQCNTNEYPCYWFIDAKCTDTLKAGSRTCSFVLKDKILDHLMSDPHIYVKRYDEINDCFSSPTAVAINFGTISYGGKIGGTQKICRGGNFGDIYSRSTATGNYLYPQNDNMKFNYSWQYSTDSKLKLWVNINDINSIDLPARCIDSIVSIQDKPSYWFRRIAVNDSNRVSYSDTVELSYYDELIAGEVSLCENGNKFCKPYNLPFVKTTKPTGGYTYNNDYSYQWQVKVNDGEYETIISTVLDSFNLNYLSLDTLDRTINNTITLRCVFNDNCTEKISNETQFMLYRKNEMPDIFQDNECGAETVIVRVRKEDIEKNYTWLAYDEDGTVNWSWTNVDSKTIHKNQEPQMSVVTYSVFSTDIETGCVSDTNYFNIDSMPALHQEKLTASETVCYASLAEIKGGTVTGGTGEKTYLWQYSYDGEEWTSDANETSADYISSKMVLARWFRRIVNDNCSSDTSEPILIRPLEKVSLEREDFAFGDYTCALREIKVSLTDTTDKYTSNDYWLFTDNGELWFKKTHKESEMMDGFKEDNKTLEIIHYREFEAGLVCKSEPITVTLYNAPEITENKIKVDNVTPCNGTFVTIENSSISTEGTGEKTIDELLNFKWYISKDTVNWQEQLLKKGQEMAVKVADTMYIKRVVYNGCKNDTSNTVLIIGQKVENYDYINELQMQIVSNMQDSSVVIDITGGKDFTEGYYFIGDGQLPEVTSNNVVLPYKANIYKDSVLQLVAKSDVCISQYDVHPLRGGIASFDGEGILCGGSEIPAIVVTDIEGESGALFYQWQYKNQFTSDFINIPAANSKEYTPSAVSVATSYRRITTCGEYASYSNVVTVNIRPLPKAKDITVSLSESELASYGLTLTPYSVEKLPSTNMSLIDSISDADEIVWQKSYDNEIWENAEKQEATTTGLYEYNVTDTADVVYYRVVATSACGESTSKSFKVSTNYAPIILDKELTFTSSLCLGERYASVKIKNPHKDKYYYTFRAIGYEGSGAFPELYGDIDTKENLEDFYMSLVPYYGLTDTTKTEGRAYFTYPKQPFDVEVTRVVIESGAKSSKQIHINVNELSAKFSYIIDGIEAHTSGEPEESVRLNQGSRVVFSPEITGADGKTLSYKWNLIAPLNTQYYKTNGGSIGREGLTSEREEPVCYFYNGGTYKIAMTVTDGQCESIVKDSALYIDKNTVKTYLTAAQFEEHMQPEIDNRGHIYLDVYPTCVSDYTELFTNSNDPEIYEVFDTRGVKIIEGQFKKFVQIDTSKLPKGVYIVNACGKTVKIVKE